VRPLEGVRVADFTNHAAGPYCALMLGLLGADIVRIESNARLDMQRRPHPMYGRLNVPTFDYLAGGKKSVTLDLKTEVGTDLARQLVRLSDVVVENFRPGVMDRLGLGWTAVHAENPSAVMLSLSAYGQEGPESGRPGYAPIFAAEGGLGWMTGHADGPPSEVRNLMDHQAGMTGAFVILSLLEERRHSGVGSYADLAAREVASMLVGESIVKAFREKTSARVGNLHEQWCPHQVYPALGDDRWVAIVVRSDEEWHRLVQVMGKPSWCTPDLSSHGGRKARREDLDRRIGEWTRTQDPFLLVRELQSVGVCAEVSLKAADLIQDDHLRSRGVMTTLTHPEHGYRDTVGAPWRFQHADVSYDRWSPALGEHNEEVICGLLGHSPEDLQRWTEQGAVH
jgi:crotonobetainyl-CoA:carnitine CoA-transferase CaiB-like acyl-CoA transferase